MVELGTDRTHRSRSIRKVGRIISNRITTTNNNNNNTINLKI